MYAKQEKIKLEDSNMAMYGSKLHKELRKSAAQSEKEFAGAGKEPGLEVWRVEKLAIKRWPKEKFGQFHAGDTYIILRTYIQPPREGESAEQQKIAYDAHFWLGAESSQDECGVAAYKTVELDDLLDGVPVQYREVMGAESDKFLKLFPMMQILAGGVESGFTKVLPASYPARLLHIQGKAEVRVQMVPMRHESLNKGDVFILDNGKIIWQWNGVKSNPTERRKAGQLVKTLKAQRGQAPETVILDGMENDEGFWGLLGGKPDDVAEAGREQDSEVHSVDKLYEVGSDDSGNMALRLLSAGQCDQAGLRSSGVFLFDVGYQIYVWVGRNADQAEKQSAMLYAMTYIGANNYPVTTHVCRIVEGAVFPEFDAHFAKTGYFAEPAAASGGPAAKAADGDAHAPRKLKEFAAQGVVRIKCLEAKDLVNTELIGRQDPYAKVSCGKHKFRTKAHNNGGNIAKWTGENEFLIGLTGNPKHEDPEVSLDVVNDNLLLDAPIGGCFLAVQDIRAKANLSAQTEWLPLVHKGDQAAGSVLVEYEYIPPIIFRVHSAKVRNVQLIGQQDPYCIIELAQHRFRTGTHDNGGKEPKWDQHNAFAFNAPLLKKDKKAESHVLHIHMRDANILGLDADIGWGEIPFETLIQNLNKAPFNVNIAYTKDPKKNKGSGIAIVSVSQ